MKVSNRKSSGSNAVELVAGILVLVPVLFFFLDVVVCVIAAMANDNVCREAARAAAAGRPANFEYGAGAQLKEDSRERARQVVSIVQVPGSKQPASAANRIALNAAGLRRRVSSASFQ